MTDIKDTDIDELSLLKERAKTLGITHHPSIGLDKLRDKVDTHLKGQMKSSPVEVTEEVAEIIPTIQTAVKQPVPAYKPETKVERIKRLRADASKLIRVRVSNMNPNKKDWEGEIYTVSNSVVGTFKKYVPFNNDAGWHIPNIIYKHLLEKECQIFYSVKGPKGTKVRKTKLMKELNVQVLPPLTQHEIHELVTQQALANALD